jgi:hypothetical protein
MKTDVFISAGLASVCYVVFAFMLFHIKIPGQYLSD